MKRSPLVSERSLSRMVEAANDCWKRQDYQQCFETLERASRMDPRNVGIRLELGRVHGARCDYAAAAEWFERAVNVASKKADALTMAGLHCRNFGRFDLARGYLERAAADQQASADTWVKLAELYERLRLSAGASAAIDRALELDPNCALALLVRARLDRLSGRLVEAEKVARSLLAGSDENTWSTRVRGWYELGAILDRQGRYEDAMAAFVRAKEMLRPHAKSLAAACKVNQERLRQTGRSISTQMLRRWHEAGNDLQPSRPLALLCGHPRSGTTLLEQVLDSHPDAISAEETDIFRDQAYQPLKRGLPDDSLMLPVLEAAAPASLHRSRADYFHSIEMFLGEPIGPRLLVDKNPSLTVLLPAVLRIFPEVKCLVALRDPRDVCLSCFMQPLPLNPVSAAFLTLEGTIAEYASVMGLWRTIAATMLNPFIEVRYEEMVGDLETVCRSVLKFLGLQWDARVLRFDEHAREKTVRSPTYADVTRGVSQGAVGRWRKYQKYLEPHLERLAPLLKAFGYE